MKILGIDPSLTKTGIAVYEQNGDETSLFWDTVKHEKGDERLLKYFNSLSEIISEESPELIIIESSFRGSNTKTLIRLGELRGVYLLLAQKRGLPVREFTPREIKKSVTGSGASSKQQVRFMVKEIFGIKEDIPLDASDAIATIICYLNREKSFD